MVSKLTTPCSVLCGALSLLACDSPGASNAATWASTAHRPWVPRVCQDGGPAFEPATKNGNGTAKLDLCRVDPASLERRAELPGLAEARARAAARLATLSQDDKLRLVQGSSGAFVGNIPAVGGLPALSLQDGPAGVARFGDVTAFPAPIALAATWDRALVQSFGAAMGEEQRGKGVTIQLAPMMNLARVPAAGRNFESYGEDPYLAGELAAREVLGIQSQKVVATAKHFVGNEQETNRTSADSRIDERTLHELYYEPFAASVAAGVGAVMCSYNRVNGAYACENPDTLGDLKAELGFSGFVMSDWGATHSTAAAANAGLDLEMPLGQNFSALAQAISAQRFAPARLDDMVLRLLTSLERVGVLSDPPTGAPSSVVTSAAHAELARQAATESITLLKNDAAILPLDPKKSVLVVGEAGSTQPSAVGGGSAFVDAPYVVSPLAALHSRGALTVAYDDGTSDSVLAAAQAADVALVFVHVPSGEGLDRASLSSGADALIAKVAAVNPNTIVVLNTPGAVLMPWLTQVRAVLVAWYPGQENGNAVAAVLYGDANPSGKLPLSFPASEADLPQPSGAHTVTYAEGLAIGYRALDSAGKPPLFSFGFGLSYTSFAYSALALRAGSEPGSVSAAFDLTNTGTRAGSEIAQLYLGFPASAGEPPQVLRGFERVTLLPGETRSVEIELGPRAFSCWSASQHARYVPSGTYRITIGGSARDPALHAELEITGSGL
jgi:beta-glucosidase